MTKLSSRRRWWAVPVGIVGAFTSILLISQIALAAAVQIEDVTMVSKGVALWDPAQDTFGCVSHDGDAFTAVGDGGYIFDDGSVDQSDAYDGGLALNIEDEHWIDGNGVGNLSATTAGTTLKVGPAPRSGLRVSRVETALASSPTLRSLIVIRNGSGQGKTRDFVWDSDLGSDGDTTVLGTSSGDTTFTTADRWAASSDDATTPGDPPLVHALYGRGQVREKVVEVVEPLAAGEACVTVRFSVRVPGNSTRYLLFFSEQWDTNARALAGANKYNDPNLSRRLLKGISNQVRNRILNWNL